MYVLSIVVCPFVLFLLATVLSVLLRYTFLITSLWYLQTHLDIIVYLFFPHLTKSQGERLILLCVRPLKPLIAFLHFNIFLRKEMIIEWFHSKLYPIGPPLLKIENV